MDAREFGKVCALAKGGRRLQSAFESALDLLTVCDIVLIRKSSGGLDLLTEARVVQRFGRLTTALPALYAAYYVAELLADFTEENDPHPILFEEALATLGSLGQPDVSAGSRLAGFKWVLLRELGYTPVLDECAACATPLDGRQTWLQCRGGRSGLRWLSGRRARDHRQLSVAAWQALRQLNEPGEAWRQVADVNVRAEVASC